MGGAAVVRAVTPNSPAEQAGIMSGDVITGLNGQPVSAANEVVRMIGGMQPGQQVAIDLSREQQKLRTDAVLAARAEPLRHSVGYPPQPTVHPLPANAPNTVVVPGNATYDLRPVSPGANNVVRPLRPGDADRDGRILDGDGRLPRRVRNR